MKVPDTQLKTVLSFHPYPTTPVRGKNMGCFMPDCQNHATDNLISETPTAQNAEQIADWFDEIGTVVESNHQEKIYRVIIGTCADHLEKLQKLFRMTRYNQCQISATDVEQTRSREE